MGWRYLATQLDGDGNEELVDFDLPLSGVQFTDVLSGPPTISGTIDPSFARLILNDRPLLDEYGSAIYIEEDDQIIGGAILTDSKLAGSKWALECTGFSGYPRDMPYIGSWSAVEIDPLNVVREIWSHLQSQPGGNLGLQVSSLLSGKKIGTTLKQVEFDTENGPVSFESGPIQLNWWETHDLGGEIDKLAASTPFDYHERHAWDGGAIAHHLDLFVPRAGRRVNDMRFVVGENIFTPPEVSRSGSDYASEILALGAGQGRTMKMAQRRRTTGRLRRVAVVEDKAAKSLRAIQAVAAREEAWRKNLDVFTELALIDHPHAPMGAVKPGDEIFIEGRLDWIDLAGWVRVLSTTVQPADGNAMKLTVTPADRIGT